MSLYERQPLGGKDWRGITYDYEMMIENLTGQSCIVCLTDFELAWLQANVVYMTWQSRWTNCPCTPDELKAMGAVLERKLMTCIDLLPYQLDSLYNQQVTDLLQAYNDSYDSGGIPELNPNTPTDFYSGNGSDDRLNALCTACFTYVYSYSSAWMPLAQASLNFAFVNIVASALIPFSGTIPMLILGGRALLTSLAIEAMGDETALDNVVCCMRDNLDGAAINQANFSTSLDGCAFAGGSHEAVIVQILKSDITETDNWLSFLKFLGDSFVLAENGVYHCPCAGTWEHTWDFTVTDGGWVENNFLNDVGANYIAGIGWSYKDATFSPVDHRRAVAIKRTFTDVTVTECELVYDLVKGTVNIPVATAIANVLLDDSVIQDDEIIPFSAIVTGNNQTLTVTFTTNCDEIQLLASSCARTPSAWDGSAVIKSATIKGTGMNPF